MITPLKSIFKSGTFSVIVSRLFIDLIVVQSIDKKTSSNMKAITRGQREKS